MLLICIIVQHIYTHMHECTFAHKLMNSDLFGFGFTSCYLTPEN